MNIEEIHIGHKIQFAFKQSGLSLSDFAKKIEINRSSLYRIFESKSIDLALLLKISDVLRYDFLAEIYLRHQEVISESALDINFNFNIHCTNLASFLKTIKKLEDAGIISRAN